MDRRDKPGDDVAFHLPRVGDAGGGLSGKQGNNSPEQGIKSADQGNNREPRTRRLPPAQSADTIPMLTGMIAVDLARNRAAIADLVFRRRQMPRYKAGEILPGSRLAKRGVRI
jgi:hypothetical protein